MSYSKIIHEYLDGGRLATPEEEVLFKTLASDEEIRSEFNKQMKLHMMAQRDMNSITPPSAVTSQLFGSLGFAMPTEHSGAAAVASENAVWGYFKKYSVLLFALLLGTSIAGISYFTYQNKQLQNEIASLSNSQNTGAEAANSVESSKNIPLVSSEGIDPDNALSSAQDHSASGTGNFARNGNSSSSHSNMTGIGSRNNGNFNNSSNSAAFSDNSQF
mgnify:CR=1 FL=1